MSMRLLSDTNHMEFHAGREPAIQFHDQGVSPRALTSDVMVNYKQTSLSRSDLKVQTSHINYTFNDEITTLL